MEVCLVDLKRKRMVVGNLSRLRGWSADIAIILEPPTEEQRSQLQVLLVERQVKILTIS